MAYVVLIVAIVQFVHASLLMKHRLTTLNKLLSFVELEKEHLGGKDYRTLVERYTGITRMVEPFPNKEGYPILYANEEFGAFVNKARARSKYYLFVTVVGFIVLSFIAAWMDNIPE